MGKLINTLLCIITLNFSVKELLVSLDKGRRNGLHFFLMQKSELGSCFLYLNWEGRWTKACNSFSGCISVQICVKCELWAFSDKMFVNIMSKNCI